jgi:hypothetical protein
VDVNVDAKGDGDGDGVQPQLCFSIATIAQPLQPSCMGQLACAVLLRSRATALLVQEHTLPVQRAAFPVRARRMRARRDVRYAPAVRKPTRRHAENVLLLPEHLRGLGDLARVLRLLPYEEGLLAHEQGGRARALDESARAQAVHLHVLVD